MMGLPYAEESIICLAVSIQKPERDRWTEFISILCVSNAVLTRDKNQQKNIKIVLPLTNITF